MSTFSPARALRALILDANGDEVTEALYAVIDALPDELSSLDDMSSRRIADAIFTALTEGPQ